MVKLLKALAVKYGVQLEVTRDSCGKDVVKAWRKLSLKLHPDKGGDAQDFAKLSAANDAWQDLLKSKGCPGRPRETTERVALRTKLLV